MISIKRYPLFDGHNDSLVRTYMTRKSENPRSLLKRSESGHLDIPRSREAGLFGGMFAIFVPEDPECFDPPDTGLETTEHGYRFPLAEAIDAAYAREFTTAVLDYLDRIVVESDGQLTIARSIADLTDNRRENSLHMVIHLEGAEAVDPDLKLLPQYYDRGVRSLGMVWSRPNAFGWGVPFEFPRTPDTGP
ncbi:MAG: dipeptidase, partial [candidate division Zixibacteria bacterium]|nr:dipeptidase [candidate division Zixibacteria bacterium]